jgi:hypothetical protein
LLLPLLITLISWDYLNLTLENEYGGDVTKPTQVIKYNQVFLQADQPIRLQYSRQIKLYANVTNISKYEIGTVGSVHSVSVPIGEFDSHKYARHNFVYYSLSEKCNILGWGRSWGSECYSFVHHQNLPPRYN